jgi:hypothetical protein
MSKPKKSPKPIPERPAKRGEPSDNIATALDHYNHEKGKRARRQLPEDELMAAARREYKALLEAQAAKGKGGRPKKTAAPKDVDAEEDSSIDE